MNMKEFLDDLLATNRKDILFVYERRKQQTEVTTEQWISDVRDFASWLQRQGIRDQNIGVAGVNCYEWFVAALGTILSGNTIVSLNEGLEEEQLRSQIGQADIRCLFLEESVDSLADLQEKGIRLWRLSECLESVHDSKEAFPENELRYDAKKTAMILYSSGTSGLPKGVMLSGKNLESIYSEECLPELNKKKFMLSVPLYHISGVYMSFFFMKQRAKICISRDARYFIRNIRDFKPEILCMVPAQLDFLMFKTEKSSELAATLREHTEWVITLGASTVNDYTNEFSELGLRLLNGYGLTETAGALNSWWKPAKKGSAGELRSSCRMRIEENELLVKGPGIMQGYYNNQQETEKVLKDGWFYTGDIVKTDPDGQIFIVGRKKNTIILSNGENVSPEELEQKLYQIPEIREVMVTGRHQVLEAVVYPGDECEEELHLRIEQKIMEINKQAPAYKQIRKITFTNEPLAKTGSGKLKRF